MKKFIIALFLIAILASVFWLFYFLNKPLKEMSEAQKEAAIAKILGRKPNLSTKDAPTGNTEYKGKYILFSYPAGATIKKQMLNGQEVVYKGLELFMFGLENPKLNASIEVINAPENITSINDYPSVRLRQIQSNLYQDSDVFVGNEKGLAFTKQSSTGFEKTAFFFLKGKIYSFSLQSPDSKKLEEVFNDIIASVKFL